MNTPFYIARTYIQNKSSQNVINLISRIASLVLIVGGASLMVVLAGFSGLKAFSLSFTNYFDPDLKILPKHGKFISISEEKLRKLSQIQGVTHFSKVLEERVFLSHQQKNHIAYIKGVDTQYPKVNRTDSILRIQPKVWNINSVNVVVGYAIAQKLNLGVFDTASPLKIIIPKAGKGSLFNQEQPYREQQMIVSDYYQVSEDLDEKYVFADLKVAQRLLGLSPNEISGIELKITPTKNSETLKKNIETLFNHSVEVKTREQLNADLYKMFQTENLATYFIFTLVLIIALFNLVGAIIMIILDKQKNLKTLYAIGLTIPQLKQIFFIQGCIISFIGAILGVLLGIFIAFAQIKWKLLVINPQSESPIPYPIAIEVTDVFVVFFTIVTLGVIASWVGSNRVSEKLIHSK